MFLPTPKYGRRIYLDKKVQMLLNLLATSVRPFSQEDKKRMLIPWDILWMTKTQMSFIWVMLWAPCDWPNNWKNKISKLIRTILCLCTLLVALVVLRAEPHLV